MAGPDWFLGIDAIFDVVFLLVTALVAVAAFRGYRFLKDKKYRLLGQGFLLLSAAYLMLTLTNVLNYFEARQAEPFLQKIMEIHRTIAIGFFLYALLFLVGLLVLLFLYLHIEDVLLRVLLAILVLFGFLLSSSMTGGFYILMCILLLFIILHIYQHWRKRKASGLVLLGFVCIFLGEVLLAFLFLNQSIYVVSHLVALAGFVAILVAQVKRK